MHQRRRSTLWKGVALVTLLVVRRPPASTGTSSTTTSWSYSLRESRVIRPTSRLSNLISQLSRGGGGGGGGGGGEEEAPEGHGSSSEQADGAQTSNDALPPTIHNAETSVEPQVSNKRKHVSHLISSISDHGISEESLELRALVLTRANEFVEDMLLEDLQHPKKLLHNVASRIPAIKHSPDSMLKITSARPNVDAGVAAFAIGTVARVCELYETQTPSPEKQGKDSVHDDISSDIITDRRFEQLVECVLCGVDVNRRKRQNEELKEAAEKKLENTVNEDSLGADDVFEENGEQEELVEEDVEIDIGLSVRDSCRAAWGLALLGRRQLTDSIGGETIIDILTALSLRIRELLLARLQTLRGEVHVASPTREELKQQAKRLAQDATCAMWTFACVDACTGIKSYPLLNVCCSILCQTPQTPNDLEAGLDDSNFEVNDVVDRLAKSDVDTQKTAQTNGDVSQDGNQNAMTDALLDSLSPNELTDVLWSIALHGTTADDHTSTTASSETISSSREEGRSLSETAGALREVAFDRLVEWLRRDLALMTTISAEAEKPCAMLVDTESSSAEVLVGNESKAKVATTATATTTVEVVDAAALLAMAEEDTPNAVAATNTEHMTVGLGLGAQQVEKVQVVDAATLLASTTERGAANIETEVVVTSPSTVQTLDETVSQNMEVLSQREEIEFKRLDIDVRESGEVRSVAAQDERKAGVDHVSKAENQDSQVLLFSAHDLCSIAWAVTDLRDPLRFLIVDLVTQIFAGMGSQVATTLPGFDKSNLVWAIARCSSLKAHGEIMGGDTLEEDGDTLPPILVARWIAESSLTTMGLRDGNDQEDDFSDLSNVLATFRPPELSRLIWSMACITNAQGGPSYKDSAMSKLALVSLCIAGSNLSMFSTEDLARIAWAFLELCDTNQFTSSTLVSEALGRVMATMEASLLRWESGQCSSASLEEKIKANESIRYTTFFGKPRLSRFIRPMMDQRLGSYDDDEDENGETFSVAETTTLPLLRDLTVDPSTLCRFASGVCRFARDHRDIEGVWTVVRVAVRLLTSKNGQLLRECNIHDIIRLCSACATHQSHGEDRELILRMVSRRTVKLLNDSFEEQQNSNATVSPLLAKAAPWELCLLYWSLGELGVRHVKADENTRLAHRKLRIVSDKPLLTTEQLESLSFSSLSQLLHGMVFMNSVSNDKRLLHGVLSSLRSNLFSVTEVSEFCQATESLANVRRSIGPLSAHSKDSHEKKTKGIPAENENDDEVSSSQDELGSMENIQGEAGVIESLSNSTTLDKEIFDLCNELLRELAEKAVERLSDCTASEMRRLLLVYSVLPIQLDAVVDAIQNQVDKRLKALEFATSMSDGRTIQTLVRQAADNAVEAGNSLSSSSLGDDPSLGSSIRSGLRSLLSSPYKVDEPFASEPQQEEASSSSGLELSDLVHRAAASACEAAARVERVERGSGLQAERTLRSVEEGAAFELGRCQELVASYRRIDFATGTRQSRYDKERRKDIGKRVLSRLFPHQE